MSVDQLLSLLFLALKEFQRNNGSESKDFLDHEIFPSMKIILNSNSLQPNTIFSLMRFLTNYNSEYVVNEFLPFYIKILKNKNIYQKAEEVVYALNSVEFCENKFSNLQELTMEVKLFISMNFLKKTDITQKIE